MIDVVVAEDRKTVIDAWLRAQHEGVGEGKVRLLSKPSRWMTLHFLDLREAHGVLLGILLPSDEDVRRGAARAPRSCRPRRRASAR